MNTKTSKIGMLVVAFMVGTLFATPFGLAMNNLNVNGKVTLEHKGLDAILFGDVNFDGVVDIADFSMLSEYLGGARKDVGSLDSADYNQDGSLDWKYDAVGLANELFLGDNEFINGDANADGQVDIADVVVLGQWNNNVHGALIDYDNSDFNGDGVINVDDRVALQEYLFGHDTVPVSNNANSNANKDVVAQNSARDLEVVTEYNSDAYNFPVVLYEGRASNDELKFVIFEKKSSEIQGNVVTVVETYYTGKIYLSNGLTYHVTGDALVSLGITPEDDSVTDSQVVDDEGFIGSAAVDLEANTVALKFNNGMHQTYSLEDSSRESTSDALPSTASAKAEASAVSVAEANTAVRVQKNADNAIENSESFWAKLKQALLFWK